MGGIWLYDLPEALAGLDGVSYHDGWEARSRSSGGYDALLGIAVHHTASQTSAANDTNYMWHNAEDRPIGAIYLARDGQIIVGCAGATNCVGKGGPLSTTKGTIPKDGGNARSISIEAANNGVGEAWPEVQQDAYIALVDRLRRWYGFAPADVFSHNEWTLDGRKIDPAGPSRFGTINTSMTWNMDYFRAELAMPDPTPIPPTGGDNMATAILHVPGRHAQFIGQGPLLDDGTVHCLMITWFGPGPEGNPFLTDHGGAPDVVHQDTLPSTIQRDLVLLGDPGEIQDSTGRWTAADFYRVII